MRGGLYHVEKRLPQLALRRALRVKPAVNAKALGLLARAWLSRYRYTGDAAQLKRAGEALDWLRSNRASVQYGIAWGYPFHWNSRVFFPRGTPSSVVTGTVAEAWLDHYESTGDAESLAVAKEIGMFFLNELNRPVDSDGHLCFSYTPLDQFKVLNATLIAGGFLARLGIATENAELIEMARRTARYVASEQNPDGSFCYWGGEPDSHIDHFHTGYVLRHLDTISRLSGDESLNHAIYSGYRFYCERLFDGGVPKNSPDSLYPVDIHSCAEALLCLSQLAPVYGRADLFPRVFEFCETRMKHPSGYYVAALERSLLGERRVTIPYLRWGQAWMLLALANSSAAQHRAKA